MFILNIILYFCQEMVREVAVLGEIGAIFEIDEGDFGVDRGRFGFFGELDEGGVGFCEVVVDEIRGGGAENTGDFGGTGNEAGEAKRGVAGGVFLVVGGFVGFVNNDETEVVDRGEESRAGANDDEGGGGGS